MKKEFFIPVLSLLLLLLIPFVHIKNSYASLADVNVCFTPGNPCDKEIINEINHENSRIWIEAYYLTSRPIIASIIEARKRGVDVKVILDKSQLKRGNIGRVQWIKREGIPVWIDNKVSIAHNKIIILGNNKVITGSYNFTASAQKHNAENMLIIKSPEITRQYYENFQQRLSHSVSYTLQTP